MHDTTAVRPELDWGGLFDSLAQPSLQVSLVVAGGGSGAVAHCFRRVGASQTFVEAVVPYSRTALAGYLTAAPRGSDASPARAHQLASTALSRADALADREPPYEAVGISLAAALPTIPKRRGTDRIHVSLHTQSRRLLWSVELSKDAFDRETAESIAEAMIFIALSELCCDGKRPALDSRQILHGLELVCKQG
jgi:hypothetical protein